MGDPYHLLHISGDFLIGACGSRLDSFALENGKKAASWQCPIIAAGIGANEKELSTSDGNEGAKGLDANKIQSRHEAEPQLKRRKLSDPASGEHQRSPSPNGAQSQAKRIKGKQYPLPRREDEPANIVAMTGTRDGKHVIVASGEDKTVRVLERTETGELKQLSERVMPKRPCEISVTSTDSTIICADKFGDVYSLPLFSLGTDIMGGWGYEKKGTTSSVGTSPSSPKPFVSTANHLTVHSVRNRRALENQLRQNQQRSEKPLLSSDIKLLLGHVSMLTHLVLLERGGRQYIVTADRDEHIRISRGIPQSHIIENFCLGHTAFITQLCFPESLPSVLISGGGDNDLFLWGWETGLILDRFDLRTVVQLFMEQYQPENFEEAAPVEVKIVVSRIRHVEMSDPSQPDGFIIVTCEGIPALFSFRAVDKFLRLHQTIRLNGNPLDIQCQRASLLLSIDSFHEPGSTNKPREINISAERLQKYEMVDGLWSRTSDFTRDMPSDTDIGHGSNLSSLLYNLENLRKRGGEE